MLKIFSDRSFLPPGAPHVVMLYPFWGKSPEHPDDPSTGRYDQYAGSKGHFLQMVDKNEADLLVLPADWASYRNDSRQFERASEFFALARSASRPAVVFFWNDS